MKLKLTRGEAIKTIGSFAAGLPFIKSTLNDMDQPYRITADQILKKAISELEYLTPADKFIVQRRGTPVLSEI